MQPLSNRTYDWLKYLTCIVLPAIGTLYTGLSKIWSLPYASEIPATILCICTFLGAVLMISSNQYNMLQDKHEPTYGGFDEED